MSKYICDRCLKEFPTKYKFRRHLLRKYPCKCNGKDIKLSFLFNKYFKNEGKMKYDLNYLSKQLKEQKKLIESLINNHKSPKITNEINNTLNILNQNNINITINDFGNEDISHITKKFVKELIYKMNNCSIINYIEQVHLKNPCNFNIFLPNKKQKFILIWKNNKWSIDDKNNVLDGMIVKNFDRINDMYEMVEKELPDNIKRNFEDYAQNFDNNKELTREKIKDNTEDLLLANNNKYLLKTQ